ncbi:carboxymuconolactone decarboxylase family protein [Nocardia rhizosphaerihabitans]|uniref:carboxymuconolactone decarboxylase family protein n=1 Tax=Nocardia rhizosphaerihabitans TaxID=1691570 RepID=UPI00366FCB98
MATSHSSGDDSGWLATGLTVRREVMGDSFVDQVLARTGGTESAELQRFVTEHVWGAVWTRPGLDRRSRSLLNLGMLTALRAHEELAGHVRGALANGLTREEIVEAIIHTAAYCGAPAALSAMRIVQQIFDSIASRASTDSPAYPPQPSE